MSFAHPGLLLFLALLLPAGGWLALRAERRHRAALQRFGDPVILGHSSAIPSGRRSMMAWTLRLGALGFGLLALARPQWGERTGELARTGRDVLVLLDLSRSMSASDAGGSRLEAARRAAWETVAASPQDRVGLVVFGGSAFLQLPLTTDQAALRLFLDAASLDDLGDPATDVSAALLAAARVFQHEGERGRRAVLLLSDGESGEGDLDGALAELRRAEIPVFAIGVGTAAGAPVPADSTEAPERFHRDHIGRIVVSRLEEADLRHAAEATGGMFARFDRKEQLERLTKALSQLQTRTLSARRSTERGDRFQWPLLAAVVLLGLSGAVVTLERAQRAKGAEREGMTHGHVSAPFGAAAPQGDNFLLIVLLALFACTGDAREGDRLYQEGRYPAADSAFRRALASDSTPRVAYNAGNALYRLERYEDAARRYRQAGVRDDRLKQRSLYNLGNALVRAAEEAPEPSEPLHRAIEAYEEALRLDPRDADAKWNLELALKRLGDDRTSGGSPGRGRSADYGRGSMDAPGYEGNPDAAVGAMAGGGFGAGEGESVEELTPEEARRLLETVQRQQLSSHEGRPSRSGPTGERDW
jgi:Ca-activated chloride channel family protein